MTVTYITLIGRAVGSDRAGFRIEHYWDGQQFADKALAVSNGFRLAQSDDFQVGVVASGRLVSVWWMDEQIAESDADLADTARQIGLKGPGRAQAPFPPEPPSADAAWEEWFDPERDTARGAATWPHAYARAAFSDAHPAGTGDRRLETLATAPDEFGNLCGCVCCQEIRQDGDTG